MAIRSNYFTFIKYQENISSFDDFFQDIKSVGVSLCISPLHNLDLNKDGAQKKPHYHIIVMYDSLKSVEQVKNDFKGFCDNDFVEIVRSLKNYHEYLWHQNDLDKAQYSKSDCLYYACCEDDFNKQLSKSQEKQLLLDIFDFMDNNCISTFFSFCQWARYNNKEFFFLAMEKPVLINNLICSKIQHNREVEENV